MVVWIVGFLIGTTTHLLDLIAGGLETYAGFSPALRLFWVSLTVFDPVAVVLLALKRPAGVVVALVIILVDIAVNWTVVVTIAGVPMFAVVTQTLFAVVLLTTAPTLWRWFGARRTRAGTVSASSAASRRSASDRRA